MKKNSLPAQQSTDTVEDLRQQLATIAARLDLETDRERSEKAAERERAAAERDAARQSRIDAAMVPVRAATTAAIKTIMRLDNSGFADLDAAVSGLIQVGGALPIDAAMVYRVRRDLHDVLDRIGDANPAAVGKPLPPSRAEQALAEAKKDVTRAEERLAHWRAEQKRGQRHGEATVPQNLLETHAYGVMGARQRLIRLEEPALDDDDEIFKRSTAGLNELSGYIGNHWEQRRAERYQAERRAAVEGLTL